ncbi:MAG: SDR family NAD(P)-dependent oxidoreductase [Bacillota bacterium]|nr:SDR family NAD(P)-dependent oxidoreductase [Bacillota bacterium]
MRLQGKVAMITGGGSGIGRAIAKLFAREGAAVAIMELVPERAREVCEEIEAEGGKAIWFAGDVTSSSDIDRVVTGIVDTFGKIDILINNAGIMAPASGPKASIFECSEEDWKKMIDVNLNSVFLVSKRVFPEMVKNGKGKVVNMSSMYGIVSNYNRIGYSTTKGAIVNMTRSMALDGIKKNIYVNAIAPGYVNSPRVQERLKDPKWYEELIERSTPIGRVCEPEEIAKVALFLASDDSDYIIGQTILVDGGWTLR